MSGIAGIVGIEDRSLIKNMIHSQRHRGPDGIGFHQGTNLLLGVCQLNSIDMQTGNQPIYNETGEKCIVFNGVIYNYKDLRQDLCRKGHVFKTNSDTEVVLHLYEEYGCQCVDYLQGMFAFAISDGQKLILCRDRFGIKPLYYSHLPEKSLFLFASEIKALLQYKDMSTSLDLQTLADCLVFRSYIKEHTHFQDIKSVLPGQMIIIVHASNFLKIEKKAYYQMKFDPNLNITFNEAKEHVATLLTTTIRSHLMSETPVGLALSGGLDSSILAMLMNKEYDVQIGLFSIGDDENHPDLVHSQIVAQHTNSLHTINIMSFDDYIQAIPACVQAYESYTVIPVPAYLLYQTIRKEHRVCLSGEGADEIFGGYYPAYKEHFFLLDKMTRGLERIKATGLIPRSEILDILSLLKQAPTFDEYLKRIFMINLHDPLVYLHLNIADKLAMAAGLEIRVPYLDHKLVDFVNSLPLYFKVNKMASKYILRRVAVEEFGVQLGNIPFRKKTGADSRGYRHFVKFRAFCNENISDGYFSKHPFKGCFTDKFDLLIFELFTEIFVKWRGTIPDNFHVYDFIKSKT